MGDIYSERDLASEGLSWGDWKFSLSNDQINEKLKSLPKKNGDPPNQWVDLFSILQNINVQDSISNVSDSVSEESPTEFSPVPTLTIKEPTDSLLLKKIEDLSVRLVDLCKQLAPKLRFGLNGVQEEMKSFIVELTNLNDDSKSLIMKEAWSQLNSDASKFCFCVPFSSSTELSERLCKRILLPWFKERPPNKLEPLSAILSAEGETVCRHLVAPLLHTEDSPLVMELLTLEELMTSMTKSHWTVLLREVLSGLAELQKWQVPVLATIVEEASPSSDDLYALVQLMSSAGTTFAQSSHFGALLVAVASCLKSASGNIVPQLQIITNNYKGSLKFKVLKILAGINE